MTADADIQRVKNRLVGLMGDATNRVIQNRALKLEDALVDLQSKFYTQLVSMAIGVSSEPFLDQHTPPKWPELSRSQQNRKRKRGQPTNEFYRFTGQLKQSLLRSKATTTFGKPIVSIGQAGKFRRKLVTVDGNVGRSVTGRFVSIKQIRDMMPTIVVDLYPKVAEDIRDYKIDEGAYFSDKVAMKMTHWRGRRDRPVLVHYMNWWMDTQASTLMRKILGVKK